VYILSTRLNQELNVREFYLILYKTHLSLGRYIYIRQTGTSNQGVTVRGFYLLLFEITPTSAPFWPERFAYIMT